MESFFRFFAQRHILAYMITFTAILLGLSTLFFIKRDIFPEVDFGELVITTSFPGASPEDVELKVTNKIEDQVKMVTGIKRYTSWSNENLSFIHIVLEPDEKDPKKVVREIRDAVSRVKDLPDEVDELPLVTELNTAVFQIIDPATNDLIHNQRHLTGLQTLAARRDITDLTVDIAANRIRIVRGNFGAHDLVEDIQVNLALKDIFIRIDLLKR